MIDEIKHSGIWYLPDNPQRKISGTITFNQENGARLELLGTLIDRSISDKIHNPEIILGVATNGEKITLYNCFAFQWTSHSRGQDISKYYGNYFIVGCHFLNLDDLSFNSISSSLKNLEEWVGVFGYKIKNYEEYNNFSKYEISYKLPNPIEFEVSSNITGRFTFRDHYPFFEKKPTINLKQDTFLDLKYKSAQPLKKILKDLTHMTLFVTLGTFNPCYPISIYLRNKKIVEQESKENRPVIVQLFYQHTAFTTKLNNRKTDNHLFSYGDISIHFATIIKLWFSNQNLSSPVTGVLRSSFYNYSIYSEDKFINMVQGLETFHRRFRNNRVLKKEDHKKKVNEIIYSVKEDHKEWLQNILHFSNEPTLHMRLEEIIDELSIGTVRKAIQNKDQFIKEVKNSRNYYVHYDKSLEKKTVKGAKLSKLRDKLRLLLICSILKESGFSIELLEKTISKNEWIFFNQILRN